MNYAVSFSGSVSIWKTARRRSVPKYRQFEHPNGREFELSLVAWVREVDGLRRALAA